MIADFPDVATFLGTLDDAERERFAAFAEAETTSYVLWLIARALGYEGSFTALEDWQLEEFPRLDGPGRLRSEARKLTADLEHTRTIPDDAFKDMGGKQRAIASLTKELRATLVALEQMERGADRRALMTAGVDLLHTSLEQVFIGNEPALEAITEALLQAAEQIQSGEA